jgi:hypothetical protein
MSTFHQWLTDQLKRPDNVGWLARLWQAYDHPRLSGVASVVKNLNEYARLIAGNPGAQVPNWPGPQGGEWIAGAVAEAVAEYRGEKAPTPQAVASQSARLAAIEQQLQLVLLAQSLIMRALGISPIEAMEPATFTTNDDAELHELHATPITKQYAQAWQELYELADHAAADEVA